MMVEVCVFVKYFNDEVLDSTELKPDCLVGKEKQKKKLNYNFRLTVCTF